jgi:hypothetical protein
VRRRGPGLGASRRSGYACALSTGRLEDARVLFEARYILAPFELALARVYPTRRAVVARLAVALSHGGARLAVAVPPPGSPGACRADGGRDLAEHRVSGASADDADADAARPAS